MSRIDHGSGLLSGTLYDGPIGRAMATTVRDVMRAPLPGVESTDPVVAAARRLRAHAVAAVPVCGAGGEFLGMLTSADIIDRCVADGRDPRTMQCGSLIEGTPAGVVAPDEEFGSQVLGLVLAQPVPLLPGGRRRRSADRNAHRRRHRRTSARGRPCRGELLRARRSVAA